MSALADLDDARYESLRNFAYDLPRTGDYGLMSVTCKTGFGVSRANGLVHAVSEMAAVRHKSRMRFAARWLCGARSIDAAAAPAPFGDHPVCERCLARIESEGEPRACGFVYRCFDADGLLLYVGSTTKSVDSRIAAHQRDSSWWPSVAHVRVEEFAHGLAARAAEVRAIRTEHPIHNVRGRRRDAS